MKASSAITLLFYLVISLFQETTPIVFTEIDIGCLYYPEMESSYVINSKKEFQNLKKHRNMKHPMCGSYKFKEIDFEKNTLLVFIAKYPACGSQQPQFDLYQSNDTIQFVIQASLESNHCKNLGWISHFLLVEKIGDKAIVNFSLRDI